VLSITRCFRPHARTDPKAPSDVCLQYAPLPQSWTNYRMFFPLESRDLDGTSSIIFMRGHQPPECQTRIGATCHVNPLFFQRHLECRWASRRLRLFSSPSLPSASFNTIRLGLVNIGERGGHVSWRGHSDVQALRTKGEDAMVRYLHNVNGEFNLHAGDSIFRAFQSSQRPILFH
jgi:hypothetical protein